MAPREGASPRSPGEGRRTLSHFSRRRKAAWTAFVEFDRTVGSCLCHGFNISAWTDVGVLLGKLQGVSLFFLFFYWVCGWCQGGVPRGVTGNVTGVLWSLGHCTL